MKYYIVAGEASGDLHGSNLIKALKKIDPEAHFRVWGGDKMEAAGGKLVKHYRDLAFMGFVEVVANLRTILKNFEFCHQDITDYQPDALILIDYPGFNLRLAKWAKQQGYKIYYYISPQLWAWNSKRVHQIKANVDRLFVILPFEEAFYKKYDYEVDFVGHPLLDVIQQFEANPNFYSDNGLADKEIIALLPGSRRQEISRMLSIMLQVTAEFPDYQFVIGGAPSIPAEFYNDIIQTSGLDGQVHLVQHQTYHLLHYAKAALVTSGTATLETALFNVPEVVCYKGNALSYFIARQLVNVKYISLVNLIVDQPLLEELIQQHLNKENLKNSLKKLLEPDHSAKLKEGYEALRQKLGQSGASEKTAKLIVDYLSRPISI